jgi:triosephosphate isomerase
MLKSVGCEYVIIGHSERRAYFGETDQDVNKKIKSALSAGLTPIVCIGEKLQEREAGDTLKIIESQFKGAFSQVSAEDFSRCIIAYEPVWAIGTGKTATPQQAEEVHAFIRSNAEKIYSKHIADNLIILYGGSVKPENAASLLSEKDIDGALVGGASLSAEKFVKIIEGALSV